MVLRASGHTGRAHPTPSPTSLPGTPSVDGYILSETCSPSPDVIVECLEQRLPACSLGLALTDQPPAVDPTRRSLSSRADNAARRRATARLRVAIAIVVVALLAIGSFLLLGGDVPSVDDEPGEFSFDLKGLRASATSHTPPPDLRDTVREAGTGVKETMDELYLRAFVDTDSWDDYGAAFALFDGPAATRAEADAEILTLGPDASEVYEALIPTSKTLAIAVLTDRKDAPATAIAEVQFLADARLKDGTSTEISSNGAFFLRQVEGEWKVYAYRVDRDDQATEEQSPTGSPS
jgi:hypothetical protein